jgi:hypothetical protein
MISWCSSTLSQKGLTCNLMALFSWSSSRTNKMIRLPSIQFTFQTMKSQLIQNWFNLITLVKVFHYLVRSMMITLYSSMRTSNKTLIKSSVSIWSIIGNIKKKNWYLTERTFHMKTWLKKSYTMWNMLLVHTYSCQSGLTNNHTLMVSSSKTSKSKKVISLTNWPSNMPTKTMAIMVLSRSASQNSFKTSLNFRLN